MPKKVSVECLECGSQTAYVTSEPRYAGLRGNCPNCKGNWPES